MTFRCFVSSMILILLFIADIRSQTAWAQHVVRPIGMIRDRSRPSGNPPEVRGVRSGDTVRIQGVIHQKLLWPLRGNTALRHAFLVQNLPSQSDGVDATSDGLFVYAAEETIPRRHAQEDYIPAVGDLVLLEGTWRVRFGQCELSRPVLLERLGEGLSLDEVLPSLPVDLHAELENSLESLERQEGMRVFLPPGSKVLAGRRIMGHGQEAYLWMLPSGHPVARRPQPYHDRLFRDAHPLDDLAERRFDNGNGARILMGSHGVMAALGSAHALLPLARTGDRSTARIQGGLVYSYGHYKIMPDRMPGFKQGLSPDLNLINEVFEHSPSHDFRVVTYNLENLYDHRDDPSDPCDSIGDAGNKSIRPPFGYLPSSEDHYRNRLKGLAHQIVEDMHSPEMLMLQELEDQDIMSRGRTPAGTLTRKASDGFPDVLQELAIAILHQGGPVYACASSRDGADSRGIACGFLYREDRVELVPQGAAVPWLASLRNSFPEARILGKTALPGPVAVQSRRLEPDRDGEKVYPRPCQLLRIRVQGRDRDFFLLNNHFSSRPQQRVGLRRDQADLTANLARSILEAFPSAGVLAGGDLNVFPRPDDPHPEHPSDQLAPLYDAELQAVHDWILAKAPANAYSYVYEGQAQVLDHLFISRNLLKELRAASFLHLNSDWSDGANPSRGISDHDPMICRFRLQD